MPTPNAPSRSDRIRLELEILDSELNIATEPAVHHAATGEDTARPQSAPVAETPETTRKDPG